MRSQIDDVTNSIDEATKSLAEYNNQIMQVHWDRIDEQANKVQNLIDENNFIIDELSRRDLTSDDTGGLTSEGNAVAGLHISNYEAYKKNAETYYAEIESINKKLANDPYNQKLIDQKEKLVKSYQDCVKGAEDEKWATIDLMKSGYDALKITSQILLINLMTFWIQKKMPMIMQTIFQRRQRLFQIFVNSWLLFLVIHQRRLEQKPRSLTSLSRMQKRISKIHSMISSYLQRRICFLTSRLIWMTVFRM